jgi:hypothetical protein
MSLYHGPTPPGVSVSALESTLVRLSYDGPIRIYRCRPFQAHGLDVCEVWVEIHVDSTVPWIGVIIDSEVAMLSRRCLVSMRTRG